MSGFNLKTEKTAQEKIHDKQLEDQRSDIESNDGSQIHEKIIEDSRGEGQGSELDIPAETQMSKVHETLKQAEQLTEGQLTERDSYQTHRDELVDDHIMKPMDAMAEANFQRKEEAYSSSDKEDTKFWDDFVGVQLEGDAHKVIASDPAEGSQLNNQTGRFKGVLASSDNVKTASIQELDEAIFGIFYKSASEKRELTEEEGEDLIALSSVKVGILSSIQDISESE